MVLKFFDTLDEVAEYIEKEENEKCVKYVKRTVAKDFGSDSELAQSISFLTLSVLQKTTHLMILLISLPTGKMRK